MDTKELEFQAILSQKLKILLDKSGKKQKDVAGMMGVTNSFLAGILNEREKSSTYRLNQMLQAMGQPSLIEIIDSMIRDDIGKKKLNASRLTLITSPKTPQPCLATTSPYSAA